MNSEKARIKKLWKNMRNNKFYIKGEQDSKTQSYVLAARIGNHFEPDNCYFDLVKNLPPGTVYVDDK